MRGTPSRSLPRVALKAVPARICACACTASAPVPHCAWHQRLHAQCGTGVSLPRNCRTSHAHQSALAGGSLRPALRHAGEVVPQGCAAGARRGDVLRRHVLRERRGCSPLCLSHCNRPSRHAMAGLHGRTAHGNMASRPAGGAYRKDARSLLGFGVVTALGWQGEGSKRDIQEAVKWLTPFPSPLHPLSPRAHTSKCIPVLGGIGL